MEKENTATDAVRTVNCINAFCSGQMNYYSYSKLVPLFLVLECLKELFTFLKKTFADNLLTPMSSKMSTSFFLQSKRN